MQQNVNLPVTLALFCKVVDNFGDIGICWRLARQLHAEHGVAVTLWVDDLPTFQRICPPLDTAASTQQQAGVTVRHWDAQVQAAAAVAPDEVADIVIEFFGCELPPAHVAAMALRRPQPVWLNLEGLSAEDWVEGCHTLPSPHPRLPLTKYFFFPGFTAKTGGLLREAGSGARRRQFQSDPHGVDSFLAGLGLTPDERAAFRLSLFCYPHAPVAALFDAWQGSGSAMTCLVPEGVAAEATSAFLGAPARPGAARTRGALTVRVLPFLPQDDYDRLLWACDFNVVRGEDSFVRAQWAGRPFLWHIYPQDENLHHKKLRAFLQRYDAGSDSFAAASLHWNGALPEAADWPGLWRGLRADLPQLCVHAADWEDRMLEIGDLASNMLRFAAAIRQRMEESRV